MYKRFFHGLLAAGLILLLALPARGAELGSIAVTLEREAAADADVVELYRVAVPSGEDYCLYPMFGGGMVRGSDARSQSLAQWLCEMASDLPSFSTRLDETGTGTFSDLEPGLYLLTQRQARIGIFPCLIPLPFEGEWDLHAYPQAMLITGQLPMTGDRFTPWPGVGGMLLSGTGLLLCFRKLRREKKS